MLWIVIRLEYSYSVELLQTGSHLVISILLYPQVFIGPAINLIFPIPLHPCGATSSHHGASLSGLCIQCSSLRQVHIKHAGLHLSQTIYLFYILHVFRSHLTQKMCSKHSPHFFSMYFSKCFILQCRHGCLSWTLSMEAEIMQCTSHCLSRKRNSDFH